MTDNRQPKGHPDAVLPGGQRTVSERVVEALAATDGSGPVELGRPLNDSVDPDALDRLFASRQDGTARPGEGSVEFTSNGYRVVVQKNGDVRVGPATERAD